MIKITNGSSTKVVTKGLYESLYSKMGYKLANEPKQPSVEVKKDKVEEKIDKEVNTKPEKAKFTSK